MHEPGRVPWPGRRARTGRARPPHVVTDRSTTPRVSRCSHDTTPAHASPASEARPPSTGWPSWSASRPSRPRWCWRCRRWRRRSRCATQNTVAKVERRRRPGLQPHGRARRRRPRPVDLRGQRALGRGGRHRDRLLGQGRRQGHAHHAAHGRRQGLRHRAGRQRDRPGGRPTRGRRGERRRRRRPAARRRAPTPRAASRPGQRPGHVGFRQRGQGPGVRPDRRQQGARRGAGHQPDHGHRPAHHRRRRGPPDPRAVDLRPRGRGAHLRRGRGRRGPAVGQGRGRDRPLDRRALRHAHPPDDGLLQAQRLGQRGRRAAQDDRRARAGRGRAAARRDGRHRAARRSRRP